MTTTSAGNGPSAGDGRDEDDDWGWFSPPPSAAAPAESEGAERTRQTDEADEADELEDEPYDRFARARQRLGVEPVGRSVGSGARRGGGRSFWARRESAEDTRTTNPGEPDQRKSDQRKSEQRKPGHRHSRYPTYDHAPYDHATSDRLDRADHFDDAEERDTAISDPVDFDPWKPGSATSSAGVSDAARRPDARGAPVSVAWPDGSTGAARDHTASPVSNGTSPQSPQSPRSSQASHSPQSPRSPQSSRSPRLSPPRNPLYEAGPGAGRPADHRPPAPASSPTAAGAPFRTPSDASPTPPPSPSPSASAAERSAELADTEGESRDAQLIRQTLAEVEPQADAATAYFYALLFVQFPELRDLFPASMDTQRDRLFRALLTAVRLADEEEALTAFLSNLGRGHRKYGTLPEHYPAVGECLLGALAQYAPRTWSQETEDAWVRAYTLISQTMIDAAADDEARAPAWWNAEIVGHEQPTPEIAVITVRADQPYPFLAGQYTSIETPWWPRVWRHYSFASSPRSDGLLTFHVKAVPTGWVSSALVHRAQPGDVLRLGPPSGTMTVDHGTDTGLLCVGGGTGIAPIRALVEDVVQRGRPRPVEVFYGARNERDLYDLDALTKLEQQHDWLSVRPVVAFPLRPGAAKTLHGQLPEAVRKSGPWRGYEAYLSGPPGMIRSGVDALVDAGVRVDRIRHDSLAELMGAERPA